MEWHGKSAAELGRMIGTGEADPVALTQAMLSEIDGHAEANRIYARTTPERALAEAEAARDRAERGQRLSALDGVPVSWKDLVDSAGVATEAGSALLKGRVPMADAPVLRNATAMGLVCLGKTHLSELAFSGLGLNPITATSPNVNDPEAVPGGSSSGAASSLAFGLAGAAVGSDTGGSVRIPAAWNDLVGLKTTHGRVSAEGCVPLCEMFDTIGPLTRTVEDAGLMLAALEGTRAPDLSAPASLKGRKLAALNTAVLDDIRDAPMSGYQAALDRLSQAGAEIVPFDMPDLQAALDLSGVLYTTEAWGIWGAAIEAQPDVMYAPIRARFESGKAFSGAEYVAALRQMRAIRRDWVAATRGFDAVLCPTAPILPPNAKRLMEDAEYYVTENLLALRNTRVGNLMGLCVLTLPTGVPSCGISFMGQPFEEERLLRLGLSAEAALS